MAHLALVKKGENLDEIRKTVVGLSKRKRPMRPAENDIYKVLKRRKLGSFTPNDLKIFSGRSLGTVRTTLRIFEASGLVRWMGMNTLGYSIWQVR